jgi:hypothetical protein
LHRSTLCGWLGACADLLRPLYDLMVSVVLQSRALHTDGTPVLPVLPLPFVDARSESSLVRTNGLAALL